MRLKLARMGLDPRINQKNILRLNRMDCRVKPGNDGVEPASTVIERCACPLRLAAMAGRSPFASPSWRSRRRA